MPDIFIDPLWSQIAWMTLDFMPFTENRGVFSKWLPINIQQGIKSSIFMLGTSSWCLDICFGGQGTH